jgi:hypothetical protein
VERHVLGRRELTQGTNWKAVARFASASVTSMA